jgi:glycerol-3-phosphate dehydrogenase subunit B
MGRPPEDAEVPAPPGREPGAHRSPRSHDVLVIGGGMAGAIAALAARAAGRTVALVRRAPGATALSSGAISVAPDAGALPSDPLSWRRGPLECARRLAAVRPDHPYAVLGPDRLGEALVFAAHELGDVLAPLLERPRFIATVSGTALACALCQRSMEAGDLLAAKGPIAVVGFRGHLAFDAQLVGAGLRRLVPLGGPEAIAVEVAAFEAADDATALPHALARAFEAPGAAERLGDLVRASLPSGAVAALLPPVLGLSAASRVPERIAARAGVPVAETLADVPSVPGLRLQGALEARLRAAGVDVLTGDVGPGAAPGDPVEVGGRTLRAAAWVLATGRFVGGGIRRRGRLEEPLLGVPVLAAEGGEAGVRLAGRPASSLTVRERRARQPLLSAGIRVDADARPLDDRGEPIHARLHAAGAVIGGHEHASDGTGLGVAILTGWIAGRAAAAAAA